MKVACLCGCGLKIQNSLIFVYPETFEGTSTMFFLITSSPQPFLCPQPRSSFASPESSTPWQDALLDKITFLPLWAQMSVFASVIM